MLKTRVVTAVCLLGVFLVALFYLPPVAWLVCVTVVASLAAWEWGTLMGLSAAGKIALGTGTSLLCLFLSFLFPEALGISGNFDGNLPVSAPVSAWELGRWFYLPAAAFWIIVVPGWLRTNSKPPNTITAFVVGAVVILPTWLALVHLRQIGALWLLALLAFVWIADTAAYFCGRAFGRHKLAPSISPGKTWEGAIGGILAVVIYGFSISSMMPSQLTANKALLFFILVFLPVMSILGDLFESMLKRQAGLKDSSNILPGHGGVLDRIDSLTSTLPLIALAWTYLSQ